jgi:putative transposase
MRLFHKDEDNETFEHVLPEGLNRYPVDLLKYCLIPAHWHLVVRRRTDAALGRLMGFFGVTHVRRYQEHYQRRGAGHLYQARYKSFSVADDAYFLPQALRVDPSGML